MRNELLKRLQQATFCVNDVTLFLDSHPNDAEALAYHRQYVRLQKELEREYVAEFGPLTSNDVENAWTWIDDPWPWEVQ